MKQFKKEYLFELMSILVDDIYDMARLSGDGELFNSLEDTGEKSKYPYKDLRLISNFSEGIDARLSIMMYLFSGDDELQIEFCEYYAQNEAITMSTDDLLQMFASSEKVIESENSNEDDEKEQGPAEMQSSEFDSADLSEHLGCDFPEKPDSVN
ncbi:hypothetical protein ACFL0K_00695 [Patescibacteria group bacterium]